MDHERFKNIAEGIQSIILSIAVVVGGIWTAWTFGVLKTVDEAKAKIESLTAPSLSMTIDTERTKRSHGKHIGLIVRVNVENTGGQELRLDLRDHQANPPLKVALVEYEHGELHAKKAYYPVSYGDIADEDEGSTLNALQRVEIKSKKTITYFVEVDGPGTYFIRFKSPLGEEVGERMRGNDKITPADVERVTNLPYQGEYWITTTYVDLQ